MDLYVTPQRVAPATHLPRSAFQVRGFQCMGDSARTHARMHFHRRRDERDSAFARMLGSVELTPTFNDRRRGF